MGMSNAASHIANAVEPLRAAAIARAVERAREIAEWILARYAAEPAAFEVPTLTFANKRAHAVATSNRATLCALTVQGEPLRLRSDERIERFVAQAGEDASAQYTAFVAKLECKVSECDSAELLGDHVWGHSTLTVRKGAQTECWRTHQIINVSKLGKVFNQWPSRKVRA
jgi:hypothetical protein